MLWLLACTAPPTPLTLELPAYVAPPPMPADNPLTVEGVALGRRLFYDPGLSADGALSCASCHQQARAFTDGLPRSLDRFGQPLPRNAMSLVNLAWEPSFTWDGARDSIEAQALAVLTNPREHAQDLDALSARLRADRSYRAAFTAAFPDEGVSPQNIARALAQFIRTIVSFDAKIDQMGRGEYEMSPLEARGSDVLIAPLPAGSPAAQPDLCNRCHDQLAGLRPGEGFPKAGLFASPGYFDDGQPSEDPGRAGVSGDEADRGRFRAPTMRNIAVTGPYLHDGRFASLEALLRSYDTHLSASRDLPDTLRPGGQPTPLGFSDADIEAVLAVLALFTDETLLSDPRYGPPP